MHTVLKKGFYYTSEKGFGTSKLLRMFLELLYANRVFLTKIGRNPESKVILGYKY